MKKFLFFFTFLLFLIPFTIEAKETNIYLFYGDGCPHCEALEEYLTDNYKNDKDVNIYKYEVWNNKENQKLWNKVEAITGKEIKGVPYFIIGNKVYQGYNATPSWEETIKEAILEAKKTSYDDDVGVTLGIINEKNKHHEGTSTKQKNENDKDKDNKNNKLNIPFIGEINLKKMS